MSKYYFGTDIMDVMFSERLLIRRRKLNIDEVWDRLVCGEVVMCFDDTYDELVMSIGKKLRLPIEMTNKVRENSSLPKRYLDSDESRSGEEIDFRREYKIFGIRTLWGFIY